MLEPGADRRLRARRDRDQAFLAAFAEDDQEGLALAHRTTRQADELAGSKTGTIEQLEQREIAQGRGLAACGAILAGLEHARDFGLIENARQRPLEARSRKRGGRIVAAEAVIDEKAEEPPQRRRSARNRSRRELRPLLRRAARNRQLTPSQDSPGRPRPIAPDRCDTPQGCAAKRRLLPPSCRGTGRRVPRLGPQLRLSRQGHVSDRASAAIILAVNPARSARAPGAHDTHALRAIGQISPVWKPVPVSTRTVPASPRPAAASIILVQLDCRPRPRP